MGKKALSLKYSDFAPVIMEYAGIKKGHGAQVQLAEVLEIQPQSITKFMNKDQLPTDRVLLFWLKNNIPMDKFEELIGGRTAGEKNVISRDGLQKDKVGVTQVPTGEKERLKEIEPPPQKYARREEDIYYSQVAAIRESGPEWLQGRQIMKLFLLKPLFGSTCHLDKLHFIVHQESNFHPSVPAGTILVVDTNDVKITSALYIFSFGGGSFALRKLDPIDSNMIRVTTGTNPSTDYIDMPTEKVRSLIVGRVVWAVYKL